MNKKGKIGGALVRGSGNVGQDRHRGQQSLVLLALGLAVLLGDLLSGPVRLKEPPLPEMRPVWLEGVGISPGLYQFPVAPSKGTAALLAFYRNQGLKPPAVEQRVSPMPSEAAALSLNHGLLPTVIPLPPVAANLFFMPVPINRAGRELIAVLPGIGPRLAERVVAWRQKNGPFTSIDDLRLVSGISDKKLNRLRNRISFQ